MLLWITLFSRIGENYRSFYEPFWSIEEIINGNNRILLETVENVLLFIPCGLIGRKLFGRKQRDIILIGLGISILIECCQWIFSLGSFEVDDLLFNTIGTAIGSFVLPQHLFQMNKYQMGAAVIAFCLALIVPLICNNIHQYQMEILASNGNRVDGAENLLTLNGDSGYVGFTDVYVKYLHDGSIFIAGESDLRSWKLIGELELPRGTYSFSGLLGTEPETVAIELEYYDENQQSYTRLTPDVGSIKEAVFTLKADTKIRAYVGVYPEAEGEFYAFPVIYREE